MNCETFHSPDWKRRIRKSNSPTYFCVTLKYNDKKIESEKVSHLHEASTLFHRHGIMWSVNIYFLFCSQCIYIHTYILYAYIYAYIYIMCVYMKMFFLGHHNWIWPEFPSLWALDFFGTRWCHIEGRRYSYQVRHSCTTTVTSRTQ